MTKKQKRVLCRIIIAFALTILLIFLHIPDSVKLWLFLVPYLLIGYDILIDALRGVWNKQPFDENFLMAIATVGAFILGEFSEGVFVMLFYQLGELFQSYAVGKSRKNVSALMDIRPDYANIENDDGEFIKVDPYDVSVGDLILLKPGERLALDGVVAEGEASFDTVALTGESVPRQVSVGDEVLSGCINLNGLLKIRVTKEFDQSTASRILELVESASSQKARSEKFITKFAKYYTPAVVFTALGLAILPPTVIFFLGGGNVFTDWIYRALSFLVISCPCALVVSVPLGFFATIGGAGKNGILIKGSNYVEALSRARIAVFDKTGTLTKGCFEVASVKPVNSSEEELIEYAAHAECYSAHPISESLKKSYGKTLDKTRVSCFTEMSGFGVSAKVDGKLVLAGNSKLMKANRIEYSECDEVGTVVHISVDGEYAGYILITDMIKNGASEAVSRLKQYGVDKTVMLTGDRKSIGEAVAHKIGVDAVFTELLPSDKVSCVEELLACKKEKDTLIFVGDGINDAPVLARADVGIAMGGLGADAAIEAADVVLMDDDPKKVSLAIRLAKKCMRIVYGNIYFAIGIKLLFLVLSAFGIGNMGLAIFADVGVMVLAVLNSIRALRV